MLVPSKEKLGSLCRGMMTLGIPINEIVRAIGIYGYEKVRYVSKYYYKKKTKPPLCIFYKSLNEFVMDDEISKNLADRFNFNGPDDSIVGSETKTAWRA
jgi:hypothetical protein